MVNPSDLTMSELNPTNPPFGRLRHTVTRKSIQVLGSVTASINWERLMRCELTPVLLVATRRTAMTFSLSVWCQLRSKRKATV